MDLYPAIDLRGGKVVQLVQGDFSREAVHADDPVEVALGFEAAGVPWLHMVDLDAARTGEAHNRELIARVCEAVSIPVQAGGGVRSVDAARSLADAGVARVVMGTAAVEQPELVARIATSQPVALGLDVRGREVSIRGWTEGSGLDIAVALDRLAESGATAVVVTQIKGEGLLAGPDVDGLAELLALTDLDVIASGGVGEIAHLALLDSLERSGRRLAGAIVGTAIYEGHVDVAEAVRDAAHRPSLTRCAPPGSSRASTSTPVGSSRASTSSTWSMPATRSSSHVATTRRARTRSCSSTSRRRPMPGTPSSTSRDAPPRRCSSRSRSEAASDRSTTPARCSERAPTRCRS